MIKLIGHHFDKNEGKYNIFEVDNLRETTKQYKKTENTSYICYDSWQVMPKSELNKLRVGFSGYVMYNLNENMAHFKKLVIADLEQILAVKKAKYDKALKILEAAHV